MKKIIIITLITCFLPGLALAAKNDKSKKVEKPYPTGCDRVGYSFKHGILELTAATKQTPQAIYFIHNIANKPIEFHQVRQGNHPYIIHSNNRLMADKWAIYATDKTVTKFICTTVSKRGQPGKVLDCENLLKVCQYPKVKFALNNRGNYWATTNRTRNSAVRAAIRQGILLKW